MTQPGTVAIVTGAGSSIGEAIAVLLAERGYVVALWDVQEARAKDVLARIHDNGGVGAVVGVDVSDQASVRGATRRTMSELGPARALVNNAGNAGIDVPVPLFDVTPEQWQRVIGTDLTGVFFCTQSVGAVMRDHGGGSVVNIAPIAGLVGFPDRTAYDVAKTGVLGLTRSMARSLSPLGIRVNTVSPGSIQMPLQATLEGRPEMTSMVERTPPRRFGSPADIAKAVAFLLSDGAASITGTELAVDGGRGVAG